MSEIIGPEKHENQGSRILEIGVGDLPFFRKFGLGLMADAGIKAPLKYVAVDEKEKIYDPNYDEARFLFESITALRANGLQLPFIDESFDCVLLSDVFTYNVFPNEEAFRMGRDYVLRKDVDYENKVRAEVENQKKLIDEIYRVLKVGG